MQTPDLIKHYPLALGLAVLLVPYLYSLLLFPFTVLNYVSKRPHGDDRARVKPSSVIATSGSTTEKFNLWKGVRQVVGPRWERTPAKSTSLSSTVTKRTTGTKSTTTKSTSKSASTKSKKSTSTATTKVGPAKETRTITKSVTETVQVVDNPVASRLEDSDGSVVIEEINIMGWHQVSPFDTSLTLDHFHFVVTSQRMLSHYGTPFCGCLMPGRSHEECSRNQKLPSRVVAFVHPTYISWIDIKRVYPRSFFVNSRNWDADVRADMIDALDKLAPEKAHYRHNAEGSDDMVLSNLSKLILYSLHISNQY